ncbi:hypothetical protein L0244_16170 [bacterium]|nr:hypothetical protein [bacterium]MCI0614524.1 hypothetical protein [bacterium]
MNNRIPRILLAISAAILLLGCFMHTSAFKKVVAVLAFSNLPAFYGNSLKALWLIDSITMAILGVIFAAIALRPANVKRSIILLLGLIPAGTSILLYTFIGIFIPAHMLLFAAILIFIAGFLL